QAALAATREIALAVLATTLSLMAVFLPVAFMGGIVGRFLTSFGVTMAFAIAVSMLVSFTVTPMMAARLLAPPGPAAAHGPTVLVRIVDRWYLPMERGYMGLLGWAMRHRWVVVAVCAAALATVPALLARAGFGFLPANDEAQFEVVVTAPEGTSA